ncbi:MAG: sugar phosphate isomerase/epimerase [Elusimicrobiota bacterium]
MKIGFLMRYDPERIAFARRHGCASAALIAGPEDPFLPPRPRWRERAAEVRDAFASAQLTVSSVGGMYRNILDPAQANELAELFRGSVELAAFLGAGVVGCFAGRVPGEPLENSLPAFKRTWSELARFAAGLGVRVAFENCPHGPFHQPPGGTNFMCTPEMWERAFDELPMEDIGLQWDPSHLVCMLIDPIETLRRFGARIFHVHAKDAHVDRAVVARQGLFHADATAHRFPGLGDSDWTAIVRELKAQGYDGCLDIEGRHDPVYRGEREDEGLLIAIRHLRRAVEASGR